jgi:hypothetical protein
MKKGNRKSTDEEKYYGGLETTDDETWGHFKWGEMDKGSRKLKDERERDEAIKWS